MPDDPQDLGSHTAQPRRAAAAAPLSPPTTDDLLGQESDSAAILRGGAWTSLAHVIPQFYSVVLSIATARILGPTDTGRQSYISFIIALVVVVCALGLPMGLQRYISEAIGHHDIDRAVYLSRLCWVFGLATGCLGAVALFVTQFFVYRDLGWAWTISAACAIFVILNSFLAQPLYALQRFRLVSLFGLAGGLLTVVLAIPALLMGWGITGFFAAGLPPAIFMALGTGWLSRREVRALVARADALRAQGHVLPSRPQSLKPVLGFSFKAFGADFVEFLLNRRSEFFFLQMWSAPAQLALYSIGYSAVSSAAQVPAALGTVVLPAVASLVGAGQMDRVVSGYKRSLRLIMHVTLPLSAAAIALAPTAVIVFFGRQYADADVLIYLMAPVSLIIAPAGAIAFAILAGIGRMGVRSIAGFVALGVNLLLDLLLIKPFAAVGAAAANTGGQLAAAIIALWVAQRALGASWFSTRLWRSFVASLVAGFGAWAVCHALLEFNAVLALTAGTAVLAVVYAAAATALKVVGADEAETLLGGLSGRAAGAVPFVRRICEAA